MQLSRFLHFMPMWALAAGLLFGACEKEANTTDTTEDSLAFILEADDNGTVDALIFDDEADQSEALRGQFGDEARPQFTGDCFQLVYPVTIAFPDGTQVTVDSAAAIRAAVRSWIGSNSNRPRPRVRPSFVFPFDVQLADGTLQTVDNRAAFRALLQSCRPEAERCLTLVYPVSYAFGDSVVSFQSAAEVRAAIRAYRQDSTRRRVRPTLVFPIQVETAAGELTTVTSAENLRRIRATCGAGGGGRHGNRDCYTYVFPISGTSANGVTATATNEQELRRLMSHAGPNGRFTLNYPISVTMANGTVVSIDGPEGFRRLRSRCR